MDTSYLLLSTVAFQPSIPHCPCLGLFSSHKDTASVGWTPSYRLSSDLYMQKSPPSTQSQVHKTWNSSGLFPKGKQLKPQQSSVFSENKTKGRESQDRMSLEGKQHLTTRFLSSPLLSSFVYQAVMGKIFTEQNAKLRRVINPDVYILFLFLLRQGLL